MASMLVLVEQQSATHYLVVRPSDDVEAVGVVNWLLMTG